MAVAHPRQRQVTALYCQGLTDRQIADRLNISTQMVRRHTSNVLHRFGLRGREALCPALEGLDLSPWAE